MHVVHMEVTRMTIEPMGSIMSVQAQPIVKPTTSSASEKSSVQITENSVQPMVDNTTAAVASAQNTAKDGNSKEQETGKQTESRIRKAVETMNKKMGSTEALFGIHEGTNRVTIKIVDRETKEVIKELPPEKTLDMIEKVWELAGILVDEKR